MNQDPLSRLRKQLMRAVSTDVYGTSKTTRRRPPRLALWASLAAALIGVPAAAAATGVLDLSPSATTSDGSVYRVTTIQDDQSAVDPSAKDGVGRQCEKVKVTDSAGAVHPATLSCRPSNSPTSDPPVSVSFSVTASQQLFVSGATTAKADKVVIEGLNKAIALGEADRDGHRHFSTVITQGKYTIVAYDANGQQLGSAQVGL